ncbi:MAG: hypothetical protein QMD86_00780 [Patescibacteria group bacterium]|nr:hypothetical protein [Patescibacteria group bacterium]
MKKTMLCLSTKTKKIKVSAAFLKNFAKITADNKNNIERQLRLLKQQKI